jgi:hypothetical protein
MDFSPTKRLALFVFSAIFSTVALAQRPTVTSFSPSSATGGAIVTITGTNFNAILANNEVFFGGVKANVLTVSSTTQLTVVVPVVVSGDAFITVRNTSNNLLGTSRRRFAQTYIGGSQASTMVNGKRYLNQFPAASKSTVLAPSSSSPNGTSSLASYNQMITTGDYNGDGFLDYAAWGADGTTLRVYMNNGGSGPVSTSKFSTTYSYTISGIRGVYDRPVDMNGDGRLDIVCFSSAGLSVLTNDFTGANTGFVKTDIALTNGLFRIAVADFNNDGKLDVAGTTNQFTKQIRILQNTSTNGTLSFSSTVTSITTGQEACFIVSGDIDGNGTEDLLYTTYGSSKVAYGIYYIKNNTPTTLSFGNEGTLYCCLNKGSYGEFPIAGCEDLDNDGDLDIVTVAGANASATNNMMLLFRNDGNWTFDGRAFSSYDTPQNNTPHDVAFTDLDGDGKLDIIASTDGSTSDFVVFLNKYSTGTFNSQSFSYGEFLTVNTNTDLAFTLGLGDMNADGKIDLISNTSYSTDMITWASGAVSSAVATVSATSLSGFSSCSNGVSAAQTFTVSATGLGTDNLVITAPTGFEVSKSLATGYASSISFAPSGGNVATSTVYVRQNQATIGTTSGAVFITANTAGLKSVVVSGSVIGAPTLSGTTTVIKGNTVVLTGSGTPHSSTPWSNSNAAIATITPSGTSATVLGVSGGTTTVTYMEQTGCSASVTVTVLDPTITVNTTSLTGMGRCTTDVASAVYRTLDVTGSSLNGDLTLTVSSNFELSYSPNPYIAQFSTIVFTPTNGAVNRPFYVRMKSGITGLATGTITLTTPNGNTVVVNLSGTGYAGIPVLTTSNATRCGSGTVTLSGSATNDGTINWYSLSANGTLLGTGNSYTTSSITGNTNGQVSTVYPSATNTCGTTARNTVTATVYNTTAPTASAQAYCAGSTVSSLVASGTNIKWYDVSTGGTALAASTPLVSGTYYATATSAANCESTTRTSVVVTINAALPILTLTNNGKCGSGSLTLSASATNMSAHQIRWYTVSSAGTALSSGLSNPSIGTSTLTVSFAANEVGTSKTYYVEAQNGCGTTTRNSIVATSYTTPSDPTTTAAARCGTGSVLLSSSTLTGMEVRWYTSAGTTALNTGTTFSTPSISSTTTYRARLWNTSAETAGLTCASNYVNAVATVNTTATWTGTGNWNDDTKWNCGSNTYPLGSENIIISSGTASLNEDISMAATKSLTVSSGATLKVLPNYALTVGLGSSLTNAGSIVLDADASDYGQLVLAGTYTKSGSGSVSVKKLYDVTSALSAAKWVQISSPVSGNLSQLGNNIQANNLFSWDAQVNNWTSTTGSTTFDAGKGYTAFFGPNGVSTSQSGTITLTGTPFNNVSIPTVKWSNSVSNNALFYTSQKAGWNLIGNPFTCNLDFGTFNPTNMDLSFYRWDPNTGGAGQGGYHAHAKASADNNNTVIPPMTSFWVRAKSSVAPGLGSGSLTHANNGRRNRIQAFAKAEPDKFLLVVSDLANSLLADNLSLAMVPGTSDEFDGEWDAWELLNGGQMPNVYANFNAEWTTAKAVDFNDQASVVKVVPVGVKSPIEMRPYRMHLNADLAQEGYTVYLNDHLLKNVHNLTTSDYVFAYTSAMEDRFELILTNAKTGALGLEEASRGALTAWVSGSELWITGLESGAQEIDVVGMDGRVVVSTQLRAEEGQPATTLLPELPAGLYTVRVRANGLERGVRFAVQK